MSVFDAKPTMMTAFNGAQYIELPDDATFRPDRLDAFSIGGFFLIGGSTGLGWIFGNGKAVTNRGFTFIINEGELDFQFRSGGGNNLRKVVTEKGWNDGQLHSWFVTKASGSSGESSVKMYIDGVVAATLQIRLWADVTQRQY